MIPKNYRSKKTLFLAIILVGLFLSILILNLERANNSMIIEENDNDFVFFQETQLKTQGIVENIITKEWLDNKDFTSGIEPWYNTTEGDSTDVKATYNGGTVNYEVLGNSDTFQLVVDPSDSMELARWQASKRYEYDIFPEDYGTIVNKGFYASHWWDEGATGGQDQNTPAVRWKRNITLPINMSDYRITAASIKAVFNATVQARWRTNGGIEVPGDSVSPGQGDTWDFARFNVEISNLVNPGQKYELAHNKTSNLGDDDVAGTWDYIYDTDMTNNNDEQLLIAILENILSSGDNQNLTIILGIDIYCADNDATYDEDNFEELLIRSLNLTFTYVKKIDQLTSLSWNQIGDMINHTNEQYYSHIHIDNARLNFKYKINQTWHSESINSEIRFLINNIEQTEYAYTKLKSYNHTELDGKFIEVKSGGYDITDYIPIEKNITLTIQILMLDEFNLDRVINISIDDVYFLISYTIFYDFDDDDDDDKTKPSITKEPWINLLIAIGAIIGAVCLVGYLVAYKLVLKYPKPVRKIRKYRKTLKKKNAPRVDITSQKKAFNEIFTTELNKSGILIKEKLSIRKLN